jgi:hypothetical protein
MEDYQLLALAKIDEIHDEKLSDALARWLHSQEVGTNKATVTCLRVAALCVANLMHRDKPPPGVACDVISAYADYFHYYVHVGVDILEKNKPQRRK